MPRVLFRSRQPKNDAVVEFTSVGCSAQKSARAGQSQTGYRFIAVPFAAEVMQYGFGPGSARLGGGRQFENNPPPAAPPANVVP